MDTLQRLKAIERYFEQVSDDELKQGMREAGFSVDEGNSIHEQLTAAVKSNLQKQPAMYKASSAKQVWSTNEVGVG